MSRLLIAAGSAAVALTIPRARRAAGGHLLNLAMRLYFMLAGPRPMR